MAKSLSVSLSQPLLEIGKIAKSRANLRSWSELAQCFLRYWAQAQGDLELSSQWAAMSVGEQGILDAALLENVLAEKKVERAWLRTEITAAVDEWLLEYATYPRTRPIAETLARRIAALATEKAPRTLAKVPMAKAFSIRLPDMVFEIAREARTRGNLRGWSELIEGFLRYWALAQGDLIPSAQWLAMDGPKRDKFDGELLSGVLAEKKARGSWLKHEIYAATDAWTQEHMTKPATQKAALKVREQMMQMAKEKERAKGSAKPSA